MRYVNGKDCSQSTMFPAVMDDYIDENNPGTGWERGRTKLIA
jgi:hypothetical protein